MTTKIITIETTSSKGVANGVAELDSDGKLPEDQLPETVKRETHITLVPLSSEVTFSS